MKRAQPKKTPSHVVYVVEGEGENAFWTKIGAAWQHEDGDGLNLVLSAIPLSGRLVVRKPKPVEKEAGR
jgi:hypothetical protein